MVDQVRSFNRFYTRHIGLLNQGMLGSAFSLTEARVLYELANRKSVAASDLAADLDLDRGYLSRILARFEKGGLLERAASADDGRRMVLRLTGEGFAAFRPLDEASQEQTAATLTGLSEWDRERLLRAMQTIRQLLDDSVAADEPVLRAPQPGDLGWIVHRQAVLYAKEYDWNSDYEALIAGIVSEFHRDFQPERERCWIAEAGGEVVGSVFLVKGTEGAARLRLLYVEPSCRGKGLGRRLVRECVEFARLARYSKVTLWTNSVLLPARRIYEKEGFRLVKEEAHRSFGKDLIGETWERRADESACPSVS